jgi:hypothetical protein
VLGLWLTIGLPILAEVSGTAGGVAAAIVDPKIVREVRLERVRLRTTVYEGLLAAVPRTS